MDFTKRNQNWFDNIENRPHPWPGLNWLTPSFSIEDVEKAVIFYSDTLGFTPIFELANDEGELLFVRMRYRGCNFIINKDGWNSGKRLSTTQENSTTNFYLYVDNVNDVFSKMKKYKARVIFDPREEFWGDLVARLEDPFGYVWDIAEKII